MDDTITAANDNHGDHSNAAADVVATLRGLRRQESKFYNRTSMFQFLQQSQDQDQECSVDTTELYWGSWRRQMIAWQFSLANTCDFHTDTIEVATSLVDRFVAVQQQLLHQANRYQVACMTGFYIAVKVHESQCLTPDQLQTLSGGRFQASDIEAMEREMLQAIQWRVNPPTIAASCELLVQLLPSTMIPCHVRQQVLEVALSLIPLILPEESFASESTLALGLACVGNALRYILPTANNDQYNHNKNLYRNVMQFLYHHLETEVDLYRTDRLQFELRSLVVKSQSSGIALHPVLTENDIFFSEDVAMMDVDDDKPCHYNEEQQTCRTSPRSVGGLRRYISILLG